MGLFNKNTSGEKTPNKPSPKKAKSLKRELIELGVIAFIIVPLINMFVLQSYAIPTSSMEGELLTGDKLFVSKLNFGPRIPNTPLAFPYVHDSLFGRRSYSKVPLLPYMRLPGFRDLQADDIVVFNLPADADRKIPVDRRTNYVKRCVAAPGDTFQVVNRDVYLNGQKQPLPPNHQFQYVITLKTPDAYSSTVKALTKKGIYERNDRHRSPISISLWLTDENVAWAKTLPNVESVELDEAAVLPPGLAEKYYFPQNPAYNWNVDNFGPLYLPKKGDVIQLTAQNYPLYERAIKVYENNLTLSWANGSATLNGQPITEYTFKMNYFFMMGDNRHNSLDSRFWGYVPEDHIVGKPVFVWLSTQDTPNSRHGFLKRMFNGEWKIRWNKSFRMVP